MASSGTRYGLIIPKNKAKGTVTKPATANVFGDDSDEDSGAAAVNRSVNKEAARAKVRKQTQLEIDKALKDDPTVYEYDNIYDNIQSEKVNTSVKEAHKKDKKPKYITGLLKMAEVRKREEEKRVERKVQKEREEEGNQFADKEAFVTSAYKKKMQEQQELEEKERREAAMEAMLDVTKQKDMSGFYRYLYRETTGTELTGAKVKEETEEGEKARVKQEPPSVSDNSDTNSSDSASHREIKPTKDSSCRQTSDKPIDRRQDVDKSRHSRSKSPHEKSSSNGSSRRRSRSHERARKHRDRRSRSRSPVHRRPDKNQHRSRSKDRKRNRSTSRDRIKKRSRSGDKSKSRDSESRSVKETKDKHKKSRDDRSPSRERKEPPTKTQASPPDKEPSPAMLPARPPDEDLDRDDSISESESSQDEAQGRDQIRKDKDARGSKAVETVEKGGREKEEPVKYARKTTEDAISDARKRFLARKLAKERGKPVVEPE